MINQPKIPDAETRKRSVAKLREVVKLWDALILDLDELNVRLEADIRKSPLTAYRLGKAKGLMSQEKTKK